MLSTTLLVVHRNAEDFLAFPRSAFGEQKEIEPVKDESAQRFKDLQEEYTLYEAARKDPKQTFEQVRHIKDTMLTNCRCYPLAQSYAPFRVREGDNSCFAFRSC